MNHQNALQQRIAAFFSTPYTNRTRALLLVASGLLTGLCVIFPNIGLLQWVSLIPACAVLLDMTVPEKKERLRRVWAWGALFFAAYYAVNFHWFLATYPLEFLGLHPAMALIAVLVAWWGVTLFQTVGAAFLFVAAVALGRLPSLRRHPMLRIPMIAALWVLLEWGQTQFWFGVPWARLPLGQSAIPAMLGTVAWFGPYVITLGLVLFNAALAYLLLHTDRLRICALSCAAVLLFVAGGGVISHATTNLALENEQGEVLRVAAVQANIGSMDKWDTPTAEMMRVHLELTEQAAREGAQLIVWSETAVPITMAEHPKYMKELTDLAAHYGVVLLIGTFTVDDAGNKYNSVMLIESDGSVAEDFYSKRRLVPFGEFIPMRALILEIIPGLKKMAATDLTPGSEAAVHQTSLGEIGSLVCFDSIYEVLATDCVREGAELLTLSTNDSWFLGSVAIQMHHIQSQLRAIETGRYMLRAAGTGQSSIISPTGDVLALQEVETRGVLVGDVMLRDTQTLYARTGNLLVWVCLAFAAGLGVSGAVMRFAARKRQVPDTQCQN